MGVRIPTRPDQAPPVQREEGRQVIDVVAEIVEVDENQLDEPALDALDEEISARIDHELSYLFQKNNIKDLVIAEIYRLVKNRRIRRLIHE